MLIRLRIDGFKNLRDVELRCGLQAATDTTAEGVIPLWGGKVEGRAGRQAGVPSAKSPRTVSASVDASTHPTALAARREMQPWRELQSEPSALRTPDDDGDDDRMSHTGAHLPNALRRIDRGLELADQLSPWIPGVLSVGVDSGPVRQQRILGVRLRDQQAHDASSLSDGTLRFIALGLPGLDRLTTGLTGLEEPENGIHPQRIPDMMRRIKLLAQDAEPDDDADGGDDSLMRGASARQIPVNTHSPLVAATWDDDTVLLAGTWRADGLKATALASKGQLDRCLEGPHGVS